MSVLDTFLPLPEDTSLRWPDEFPPHVSASSLSMFERCAEMWRRRYVLGEIEPPSGALVWGSADTKAHAVNFVQKIESHEDLSTDDVQGAFAALFDAEVDAAGGDVDWRDDDPADLKDRGVALVATYHRQVSPRVQPTAVEERFELQLPGVPVPFIGYIDVETGPVAIERKTAKARSQSIPPWYRVQTMGYALAAGKPVELHISAKTKTPAVYTPEEEPGLLLGYSANLSAIAERAITTRVRALLAVYHEFGPDQPWPDAIGTQSWHMAVCEMCGWGPNGSKGCTWWS